MGDQLDFDINESLKQYLSDPASIATTEADPSLIECENDPDSLDVSLVNSVLNPIIDAVAESPDAIIQQSSKFDTLQFLLKCAPTTFPPKNYIHNTNCELFALARSSSLLSGPTLSKILDLVVTGLSSEADIIHNEGEIEDSDTLQHHKRLLEIYAFLLQWSISAVESKAAEKSASGSASVARAKGGKGAKSKAGAKDAWDATSQIQQALDAMSKVMKLRLAQLFVTTSERDTVIGMFTRAVYLVQESETRMKNVALRMHTFKVLCIAIKHHGHAYGQHLAPI